MAGILEHANITVADAKATAAEFAALFDWHIRWEGGATNEGYTVHAGNETSYLAIYAPIGALEGTAQKYRQAASLNHLGSVVDDLDATEARVRAHGLKVHSHYDYEPGRRFYFMNRDGVEVEVVSYA